MNALGEYHLAGDFGGTKTSLALYESGRGLSSPCQLLTVANRSVPDPASLVDSFLRQHRAQKVSACFAVAGPVTTNRVRLTNYPAWTLDGDALQQRLGCKRITLVNDLVATALGALHLPPSSLRTISPGQPDPRGAKAVIAPGTGLGEAFLVRRGDVFVPYPSEGGHRSFAPVDEQQARLLRFMSNRQEYVSTEHVCSGRALPALYDFLAAEKGHLLPTENSEAEPDPDELTRAIIGTALGESTFAQIDPSLAGDTLRLFVRILAAEAASLVLTVLATGGLYIGGGIPPRILPYLTADAFQPFFSRGVYRDMLAAIPVSVILDDHAALIGAAACSLGVSPCSGEAP